MTTKCPLCRLDQTEVREADHGEQLTVACRRCGDFKVTRSALRKLAGLTNSVQVSAWLRSYKEFGGAPPCLNTRNIADIMSSLPTYSVEEKQRRLLRAIERNSKYPGAPVPVFGATDHVLAFAENSQEFKYHVNSLAERGLVADRGEAQSDLRKLMITPAGWDYLSERRSHLDHSRGFVAMSFSDAQSAVWKEAYYPAIRAAGFDPHRVDSEPHIERIDVKIMADIKESRFVVADVTEQKQGVYFEAGYAMGLGIPVIWTVREDDLDNVHFDTRQYNHIVWQSSSELVERLTDFILAVIGRGPVHDEGRV